MSLQFPGKCDEMSHKFIMYQIADPCVAGEGDSNGILVHPSTLLQATIALCVSLFRSLLMTVVAVPRLTALWYDEIASTSGPVIVLLFQPRKRRLL